MLNPDPFLLHLPPGALDQPLMLEASAGTGKTFTLTRLVLAYLLYKNIPIDKILIITFTRNATAELKDRMNQLLHESLENEVLSEEIKQRIIQIIADFDSLNIMTINKFLLQIFQNSSMEIGINPLLKVTEDSNWLSETAHDYFRRFGSLFEEDRRMQLSLLAFLNFNIKSNYSKYIQIQNFSECFPWLIDNILSKVFLVEENIFPADHQSQKAWEMEEKYASGEGSIFTLFHRMRRDKHSGLKELNLSEEMMAKSTSITELLILLGVQSSQSSNSPWHCLSNSKSRTIDLKDKYPQLQELYSLLSPLVDNGIQKNPHLGAMAAHFLRHFHHHTSKILKEKQEHLNVMRLEDPTAYLYTLLQKEENSTLLHKLRAHYHVALIDEFQDTSYFQWAILQKLFQPGADKKHTYALIGDPKQLIYYFRGATPQTYAAAKKELHKEQIHELKNNFRSHLHVLSGINFWFSHIFENTSHGYIHVQAANENVMRLQIPDQGKQAGITFLTTQEANYPLDNGKAKKLVYAMCVQQIAQLLHNPNYQLIDEKTGEHRRIRGRDIACLVSIHQEGKELKTMLDAQHIPSILLENKISIYETQEYEHVLLFIKALAHPFSKPLRNCTLLSPLFGFSAQQLLPTEENTAILEEFYLQFNTWRHEANNRKIAQIFDQIFYQYGYFERLMAENDGERRFVNMRHLVSILLREERNAGVNSGPGYLYQRLKILKEQNRKEEIAKIRLETDTDAIRILTIHQAKGLEYNIVFGIFGIKGLLQKNTEYAMQKNQKPILDLSLSQQHSQAHLNENLQENMRNFYVMATRAKSHLFLPLVITKSPSYYSYALSFLCGSPTQYDITQKVKNEQIFQDIENLCADANQPFSLINLEISSENQPTEQNILPETDEEMAVAVLQHQQGFNQRIKYISSYTSLWQNKQSQEEEDHLDEIISREEEILSETPQQLSPLNIRGGISLGNAFHSIMETLPFHFADTSLDNFLHDAYVHDVVDIMIRRHMSVNYHYDREYIKTVKEMVWNSLNSPIQGLGNLRLAQLSNAEKLHEVEFLLHIPENCILQAPSLRTEIKNGYLRGFLDLIFIYRDRYFVADWKTTRLGGSQSAYIKTALPPAMSEHGYDMQALIYTYALSQYLESKGIRAQEKIGGVIYIFSRGANPAYPGDGIDMQYPSQENIRHLFTQMK